MLKNTLFLFFGKHNKCKPWCLVMSKNDENKSLSKEIDVKKDKKRTNDNIFQQTSDRLPKKNLDEHGLLSIYLLYNIVIITSYEITS